MFKKFPLLVLVFALAFLFGVSPLRAQSVTATVVPEKFLVKTTLVKSYSLADLKAMWKKTRKPEIIVPVSNGVNVYEITYKALWIDKKTWIDCSGICYVPQTSGKKVATAMYGHGTEVRKNRSIDDQDPQQGICMLMAADGYLTLFPDYYGMGSGEGFHLYQHAWSEAMSFVYMLYAVEELKKQQNVQGNGQLFLTGYSQGGHAAMAAHKYLEELNDPRFRVTAAVPMSGAYDMAGIQADYMHQKYPHPFYLPYLITSYQTAYKILDTENIYSIFVPPYDTLLPRFFGTNRQATYADIDKLLPEIPSIIIKPEFLKSYQSDPNFAFKVRLQENGLTNWKPKAPLMLCACKGDREVNYQNSTVAYDAMRKNGVTQIRLNNLSDKLDHNTCAAFAVLAMKHYFNRFRKDGKNPKMLDLPWLKKFLIGFVKRKEEKNYQKTQADKAYH